MLFKAKEYADGNASWIAKILERIKMAWIVLTGQQSLAMSMEFSEGKKKPCIRLMASYVDDEFVNVIGILHKDILQRLSQNKELNGDRRVVP